jgi:thiosulfate/3-mercaptopyruvate sulfurtransferase
MLVSPEALHERMTEADDSANGSLVIFDCRFHLGDPDWGRNQYIQSHIPRAHYLDLERDLSSQPGEHGGRHPLPDLHQLARRLGEAGVTRRSTVVVYDSGEGMATRAWWLIRYMGVEDVRVLDGDLRAWRDKGNATSAEVPDSVQSEFELEVQQGWTIAVDDVRRVVNGELDAVLIDARARDRYLGEVEPIDAVAGHIPGAVNAPWLEGVSEDGRWKAPADQRSRFADIAQTGKPIVVYCGSGVTACADIFALTLAGIDDVRLYPGSWSDWISYPDHLKP